MIKALLSTTVAVVLVFAAQPVIAAETQATLTTQVLGLCKSGDERALADFFSQHLDSMALQRNTASSRAFFLARLCRATGGFEVRQSDATANVARMLDAIEVPGFHANVTLETDADGKIDLECRKAMRSAH